VTRRLTPFLLLGLALVVGPGAARADDPPATEVVVVSGSLDPRLIDFVANAIESSRADVVVIQLDSSATLDDGIEKLIALVADPPVPVAVYAGPDPATVAGGALRLLAAAPWAGAAPGVVLGPASPTLAGGSPDTDAVVAAHPDLPSDIVDGSVVVSDDLGGFLDTVEPSIGQFVIGLDGQEFSVRGESVVVSTAVAGTDDDGMPVLRPRSPVNFVEPGLVDATLRLAVGSEVAFFFLVAGLSLAIFEFYAAGPGVAAAFAVACLLLAGYGMAVLPVQWWAVGLVPLGLIAYTVDFQRNDLGWKSMAGTAALLIGGLAFTDAAPQLVQTWWIVLVVVTGTALWFGFALTTVVRARFSTQTIGRVHLIGRVGVAESAIAPDGIVLVDGARWRARSTRGSGIGAGDRVSVQAVEGIILEVDPVRE
jgi:membrane-bound serine protease (ClpP class)